MKTGSNERREKEGDTGGEDMRTEEAGGKEEEGERL